MLRSQGPVAVRALFVSVALSSFAPTVAVPATDFRRGDSNADGALDISDPVHTLAFLFLGGIAPSCSDAADSNDDGGVDISDPVHSLGFLFLGGPSPPPPGPFDCGSDPTPDPLDCAEFASCPQPPSGPTTIVRASPSPGDTGVAVTRETIIELSGPVDPGTAGDETLFAEFGGRRLPARLHVSSDSRKLTLFYREPLPASARVRVTVRGDELLDGVSRSTPTATASPAGRSFSTSTRSP